MDIGGNLSFSGWLLALPKAMLRTRPRWSALSEPAKECGSIRSTFSSYPETRAGAMQAPFSGEKVIELELAVSYIFMRSMRTL